MLYPSANGPVMLTVVDGSVVSVVGISVVVSMGVVSRAVVGPSLSSSGDVQSLSKP